MMRPRLNEFVQVSVRGGVSRGRVTAVREGERYDIQHQDGSRSVAVPASAISALGRGEPRKPQTDLESASVWDEPFRLAPGDRVDVRPTHATRDESLSGAVERCRADGTYDVALDSGPGHVFGVSRDRLHAHERSRGEGRGSAARRRAEKEREEPPYGVGSRVEGRFHGMGKAVAGTITRVNAEGEFTVDFDDGRVEDHVRKSALRDLTERKHKHKMIKQAHAALGTARAPALGERVRVAYNSLESYPATVTRCHAPTQQAAARTAARVSMLTDARSDAEASRRIATQPVVFDVRYEDGTEEAGITRARIRLTKRAHGEVAAFDEYDDAFAANEPIPIGARVKCLARSAGCRHWFEGEISARAGDAYQVRFSDHQRDYGVPRTHLRLYEEPADDDDGEGSVLDDALDSPARDASDATSQDSPGRRAEVSIAAERIERLRAHLAEKSRGGTAARRGRGGGARAGATEPTSARHAKLRPSRRGELSFGDVGAMKWPLDPRPGAARAPTWRGVQVTRCHLNGACSPAARAVSRAVCHADARRAASVPLRPRASRIPISSRLPRRRAVPRGRRRRAQSRSLAHRARDGPPRSLDPRHR